MRRAQITVEFLIIFAVLAILSFALVKFYVDLNADASATAARLSARSSAILLATAIDKISQAGDGASISLELPERLSTGATYSLAIYPSLRRVEVVSTAHAGAMSVDVPLATNKISGTTELWGGARVSVRNKEGVVFVQA